MKLPRVQAHVSVQQAFDFLARQFPLRWPNLAGTVSHIYNAADYGDLYAGASIQAAIDAAEDAGGGLVYVPTGDWTVNTTLTMPFGTPIHLHGAGRAGAWPRQGGTRLIRTSGTNTIMQIGDDDSSVNGYEVELYDLEFRGSGLSGYLLDAAACNPLNMHRCHFVGSASTAVRLRRIYNSTGSDMRFASSGSSSDPAVIFAGLPLSQGGCDTMLWTNLQFEGNAGTSLQLTGDDTNTNGTQSTTITFSNVKMEGNTGSGSYVDFDFCQDVQINGLTIHNWSQTGTPIKSTGTHAGTVANEIHGLHIDFNGTGNPAYVIEVSATALMLGSLNLVANASGPTTGGLRIASNMFQGTVTNWTGSLVTVGQILSNLSTLPEVVDQRSTPTVASASTITLPNGFSKVNVTGTTDINTITLPPLGTLVVLDFSGVLTVKDGTGNMLLAGDFTTSSADTLTLMAGATAWREVARSVN